ncbi:autophagy-related protein 13 isoform X1 [Tachysurus ichikawai]
MELETWCLEMNEKCEKDIKVSYTVYTRLSLLLKSLLAITRVTPAYKLSRNQGHDYVILYRIYFGDVQLTGLGEVRAQVCLNLCRCRGSAVVSPLWEIAGPSHLDIDLYWSHIM